MRLLLSILVLTFPLLLTAGALVSQPPTLEDPSAMQPSTNVSMNNTGNTTIQQITANEEKFWEKKGT